MTNTHPLKYSLSPALAVLDSSGLAATAGWITVYHAGADNEYTGASNDYLMQGVGLSAGCYPDAPELPGKPEQAVRRSDDLTRWEIVADHRGKTAWNTADRTPIEITFLGEIPDALTLTPPTGDFDKWNGKEWVTDEAARKSAAVTDAVNQKTKRLAGIREVIGVWQTQLQMGDISDDNKARLTKWLDYYNQIDAIRTDNAPDIHWPDSPEENA